MWKKPPLPDWLGMCNTLSSISSTHNLVSNVYETNLDQANMDNTGVEQPYLEPCPDSAYDKLNPDNPGSRLPHLSADVESQQDGYQNLAYNHDIY